MERIMIEDIKLKQTCGACPEQYDAYIDVNGEEIQIGYLRLRHGYFSVQYALKPLGTVYEVYPIGDGIFDSGEREFYLEEAKEALANKFNTYNLTINN